MEWPRLVSGISSGMLWGFLASAGATPHAYLVLAQKQQQVYSYTPQGELTLTLPLGEFIQAYVSNLIQVTLTFALLCLLFGWVVWQLLRIRPRGAEQPPLFDRWRLLVIEFLFGGIAGFWLFENLHLHHWFRTTENTLPLLIYAVIGFLLPVLSGAGIFLIWFLRLKTVRAPDWETHYPRPANYVRLLVNRLMGKADQTRKGEKGKKKKK